MVNELQIAPDFERTDQEGRVLRLSSLKGKIVILYFYPRSDTPACTAEACAFRDVYADLAGAGCEVIGVSHDQTPIQQAFAARHKLPFHLISDPAGELRTLFGVPKTLGLVPGRVTFVIDRKGVVQKVINTQFRPLKHVQDALELIRAQADGLV